MIGDNWEDGHVLSGSQKRRLVATAILGTTGLAILVAISWPLDLTIHDSLSLIYPTGAFLIGIYLFLAGFAWLRKRQLMTASPTASLQSVSMGTTQIEATAQQHKDILTAPVSGKDALAYWYEIETYHPLRRRNKWQTEDDGQDGVPFIATDDTGAVRIDPHGAELELEGMTNKRFEEGETLPNSLQELTGNEKAPGKRRYTEYVLSPGDTIYMMGTATDSETGTAETARIEQTEDTPLFLISETPKKELVLYATLYTAGGIILGAAMVLYGLEGIVSIL